jgi:predicted TIM-barrel fold metal-dependent hydrolase
MITEYPLEHRRYDQPEYEPFWAAAATLDMPLSCTPATRRQGKIRGAGDKTLARRQQPRDQGVLSGAVDVRHDLPPACSSAIPTLTLAIVEFELSWAPHILVSMDYTYRERTGEAIYRFKDGMRPSDFFHRNVVLSFQEDAIGIRLRDVIGVDNMMWGSDYPHSESTFPQSRKILAEILAGVPEDEQAKIVGANTARVYGSRWRKWPPMLEEPTSLRIEDPGIRALFTEAARFQSWLDVEAALAQAQAELGSSRRPRRARSSPRPT